MCLILLETSLSLTQNHSTQSYIIVRITTLLQIFFHSKTSTNVKTNTSLYGKYQEHYQGGIDRLLQRYTLHSTVAATMHNTRASRRRIVLSHIYGNSSTFAVFSPYAVRNLKKNLQATSQLCEHREGLQHCVQDRSLRCSH